jgi:phage protein D
MPDPVPFANARPTARIDGLDRPNLEAAVLEAVVVQPAGGMDSAEIRLNNWGPVGEGPPGFVFQDIALGARIELFLGQDTTTPLFDGEITAIEERYGDGAPQLILLAEDRLHRLALNRRSRVFENQSCDAVVASIAQEAGLSADVRVSQASSSLFQLNESDLAFLRRLLGRFGVAPRLRGGTLVARVEEAPTTPVPLGQDDQVRRLRVMADLARQPSRAVARGYDLKADEAVTATAERARPATRRTAARDVLTRLGWPGEELFAHPPPTTQGEADDYAAGAFAIAARRFLHGDLICDGNPAVVAGATVDIGGVSDRIAGIYRVMEATHHFSLASGYETFARIARADWP